MCIRDRSIACSRWEEPFGRTSLEAASRGSAVINSNRGGLPETSKNAIILDNLSIKETLPIIKNCDLSICNDSSFSHLSAALGIKTITLMVDTPIIYGNYNSRMFPIIPEGVETVNHHTDGKEKINPEKVYKKVIEILN